MHDIQSLQDIRLLVDNFYGRVRQDALLGPIFDNFIQDRWPQHLEKMYSFWQTLLLEEHTYFSAPFPPHARLPIEAVHFERWKALFTDTVDSLFTGEKALEAKWRADKMAAIFQFKIDAMREDFKPLA